MRLFQRLRPLWLSWYSPAIYRQAARDWRGLGFLYLFILLALAWIPVAVGWHAGARRVVRDSPRLTAQLPRLDIRGGRLSASPPGRHEIRDPDTGRTIIVIDDTLTEAPATTEGPLIVVTSEELAMLRPSRGERRVWRLSQVKDMTIEREGVDRLFRILGSVVTPIAYVGALVASFIFRGLQILLYGAIAGLLGPRMGVTLDNSARVRLAAVAVTPVILLNTAVDVVRLQTAVWWWWPVCFVLAMAYLVFGLRANRDATDPQPVPMPTG